MGKEALISIVMSTYNEPKAWVEASINSILNQSYNNIELIIICDNPSNKELVNILQNYKSNDKINIIMNEKNLGLTSSLNKALKFVNGDFVARMDSDDVAEKDRLLKQYNYLINNNLDLIGGGVLCIDENDRKISAINNLPKENESLKKKIVKNSCVPHPTWFAKREVFASLNGYRDIDFAEDYDFILRALAKGFKLGNINEIVLKYRIRSGSISNSNGLKQFITSQVLVDLYNQNKILEDTNRVKDAIKVSLSNLTKEEEAEYYNASKMFMEGCVGIKNFNVIGPFKMAKALMVSKYYRKKILCYTKGLF